MIKMSPFNSTRSSVQSPLGNEQTSQAASAPEASTISLPAISLQPRLANATSASISESQGPVTVTGHRFERLSIPWPVRIPIASLSALGAGFILGAAQGTQKAGLRYRAENAHRMPITQTGWFLYQKSKNYHSMLGGIKEGTKFGLTLTGWATFFVVCEEVVDQGRMRIFANRDTGELAPGQRDFCSTVVASMTTAGLYSWRKGMDHFTAARTARMALKYSLIYGILQDGLACISGEYPLYVERILRTATRGSQPPQSA